MRILHTSDWHVGKRLGRYDRMDDHRAALAEIAAIADAEQVDLVIVAGDLFDRAMPSIDALRLVLDTLEELARDRRPVVAIAGNHDSAALFELLAPLLGGRQVHLVGAIKAPGRGGVLALRVGRERALIGCLPFLREGQAVDFMTDVETWHGSYAERIAALCAAHDRHLRRHGADAVRLLVAHFTVHGVRLGGAGGGQGPRGERALHLGAAYAATGQAIPEGVQYVAMGHIHAPQEVPGARVPATYAGSPLELDFGEAGERKRVVVIEAAAGDSARVRSIALTAGRRLVRASGSWSELAARAELRDVYLDLTVVTDGPDPGLADRARQAFPYLVKVRADYPRLAPRAPLRADQPWDRLYTDYCRTIHQSEPAPALLAAFREVLDRAADS